MAVQLTVPGGKGRRQTCPLYPERRHVQCNETRRGIWVDYHRSAI